MEATDRYVSGFFAQMSKVMVTLPPAVGGRVCTRYSLPLAGADAMFAPLEPSRFSAPQFWPESGSPEPALPAVQVGWPYEYVICSLDGPVPAPPASRSQISNEWVVALPKFFTPLPVDDDPGVRRRR